MNEEAEDHNALHSGFWQRAQEEKAIGKFKQTWLG